MDSCRRMSSRSVVPPIPSDVNPESETSRLRSTSSAGSAARILSLLIRMPPRVLHLPLRAQQHHQFVACAAHVSRADGYQRVARLCFAQQEFNRVLHGAEIMHVLVARFANALCQFLAGDAWNRRF